LVRGIQILFPVLLTVAGDHCLRTLGSVPAHRYGERSLRFRWFRGTFHFAGFFQDTLICRRQDRLIYLLSPQSKGPDATFVEGIADRTLIHIQGRELRASFRSGWRNRQSVMRIISARSEGTLALERLSRYKNY